LWCDDVSVVNYNVTDIYTDAKLDPATFGDGRIAYAHPFFWTPYTVIGDDG